jgi:hypothetical protein
MSWPTPVFFRKRPLAGIPSGNAGQAACSSPPERLFGFVNDVAPGQADIVQVALGPMGEFLSGLITLPPGVEGLAQLAQNAPNMMICHHFMVQSGHF